MCTSYTAHKNLWTVFACCGFDPYGGIISTIAVRKPLYVNHLKKFCFRGHVPYCQCRKMITIGFTGNMYVCLLKKPIEFYRSTTYFAIFLISLSDFHQRNGENTCCKICGVDKLTNNWNLYKKSTRPKLTLYIYQELKYGRTYFFMTGNNIQNSR